MIARALAKPSNLLVLDEPTNDLDLETLDLLQDLLSAYEGTVLLVSHDRDFLDRLVTSVINAEGNGKWQEYAGGYSDMIVQMATATRPQAEETVAAPTAKKQTRTNTAAKSKLSFKEKHALETLPKTMADVESKIEKLKSVLADPQLFTRDPEKFRKAVASLEKCDADLASYEEQWLELEMLREELEGGTA